MSMGATLRADVSISGVGLFTGAPATLTIRPTRWGAGIAFVQGAERIAASIENLAREPLIPAFASMAPRHTCLRASTRMVATVEHILSALAGLGVTDAQLSCDGPEVPIMDGSAQAFVQAIMGTGLVEHERGSLAGASITVERETRVERGDASIVILPRKEPGCSFTYVLEYPGPSLIPAQRATWDGTPEAYATQIAPARTYCLEQEAVAMRGLGLFGHLTPRDMLVIGAAGPIDNQLRFSDEPARHKLLDLIGDLSLVGRRLQADVIATRSGHALAHEAARCVIEAAR